MKKIRVIITLNSAYQNNKAVVEGDYEEAQLKNIIENIGRDFTIGDHAVAFNLKYFSSVKIERKELKNE